MLPTPEELQAFLESAGAWHTALVSSLQGALDWASDEWERRTECKPFLADGGVTTRRFDAPGPNPNGGGRLLFLGCWLAEGVSVAIDGSFLIEGEGFVWEPVPGQGEPAAMVRFLFPVYSPPQTITVAGKWGYSTVLPERAKQAQIEGAAARLATFAGGLRRTESENAPPIEKRRKAGEIEQEFAVQDASKLLDFSSFARLWQSNFVTAAQSFRVVSP